MPSIRSCLASIAFVALAFSPVATASVHHKNTVVARDNLVGAKLARSVESPAVGMEKRAAAKSAAAKRALARRAAKAERDGAASLEKRKAFTGSASTSAFATYLDTKCSRDKYCVNAQVAADLPTNGAAVCNLATRHCVISCAGNFILQSDGTCLEGASACPTLSHGIYTVVNGVCTPQCNQALGYLLTFSTGSGTPRCTNVATSTSNCGGLGIACPASYNGAGITKCYSGVCGLQCPSPTFYYTTASGKPYCA